MSAPIENIAGELKVETSPKVPEELDLSSPKLDPLKALYSESVFLPFKNPTLYNNLAEYENVVIKGRAPAVASKRGRGNTRKPGPVPKRTTLAKADSGEEDEAVKLARQRRENMYRNVFTRMASIDKGPLTILKRAVDEHLRIKVWTRSAVTYRGYCKAFLIAFDKHFNMALMDVDETYRLPKVVRKPKPKKSKKEDTDTTKSETTDEETGTNLTDENTQNTNTQDKIDPRSDGEDTDSGLAASTQKLSIEKPSKSAESPLETNSQSDDTTLVSRSKSWSSDGVSNEPDTKSETVLSSGGQDDTNTGAVLSQSVAPPPDDQEDTEVEYITKHRHVNQLFVRGDNVVSVMLLD